ncbi:hypothetical protein [Streptomyces phytophilus]|uniref:hypothetical protein n=1 Tax=Streptomyces phytophilus TaxID=722715 RepID=UPI0015F0FF20|nr:hypothetical protein [Streptomyces phytophilus]
MPAFLIRYPKGEDESIVAQDDPLTLTVDHGWAVFTDDQGPCIALSAMSGAVITRIDQGEHPEG